MSTASPDITLAVRLKTARDRLAFSQVELAELLGVAERTLQGWEAGTKPQPRHRRRLLAFLAETEAHA